MKRTATSHRLIRDTLTRGPVRQELLRAEMGGRERLLEITASRVGAGGSGPRTECLLLFEDMSDREEIERWLNAQDPTFGFVPVFRCVNCERLASWQHHCAAIDAVDRVRIAQRTSPERIHGAVPNIRGPCILPSRYARTFGKKRNQAAVFEPHHIIRREMPWQLYDRDNGIGGRVTKFSNSVSYVIGRSERRRRLQEHDDFRLPTLLFQKVDSRFDNGQHRRVISREFSGTDKRHLDTDATPFGGRCLGSSAMPWPSSMLVPPR